MTIGKARSIAKGLNAKERLKRQEEQYVKFQQKLSLEKLRNAAFLPDEFVAEFEHKFLRNRDSETESSRRKTPRAHTIWRASQKMIRELGIPPWEWFENRTDFYDWLAHQEYSIGYSVKILKIANLWGFYFCKKMGKPFLPMSMPRGLERKRLIDSYYASGKLKKKASAPLTPHQLNSKRTSLKPSQFNWLFLSVWFGLRPKEIDNLENHALWKIERMQTGTKVLWVYQTKLFSLPPEDRWKLVPILYDEQEFGLRIIKSGNLNRPIVKTLKKHFSSKTNLYGGRKGFTDLMLEKGHRIEAISQWLGHSSIDRTWRTYKQRTGIKFSI